MKPYQQLGGTSYLLGIDHAGHYTFSNMCELVELLSLPVEEFDDGCGPDSIPSAQAHELINRYAIAFFQLHVQGENRFAGILAPIASAPEGVARYEVHE
ncbi:MAG: hypothetical protein R3B13_03555 [Polyangiaceae bacterium]